MKASILATLATVSLATAQRYSRHTLRVRQDNGTNVVASNNGTSVAASNNASMEIVPPINNAASPQVAGNLQQADPGGDDCGDGPVAFNPNEWNFYEMDKTLQEFYEGRVSSGGTGFDFALEWAKKYGSDLKCPVTDGLCTGTVGDCKDYPGSDAADKSRGLLGLTAIGNAQLLFKEMWNGIEAGGDELLGKMNDFASIFLADQANKAAQKVIFDSVMGLFGAIAGAVPGPQAEVVGGLLDVAGPGIKEAIFKEGEEDPLKDFSKSLDLWGTMQNQLKESLDLLREALFSNGDAGDGQVKAYGQTLPGFMQGGAMLDPKQYDSSLAAMRKTMTGALSIKLIEAVFKGQNAFMVYVDGIDKNSCENWVKGHADLTTYCPPEGMYFLVVVNDKGEVESPQGWSELKPSDKNWGDFGYTAQQLMHGTAWAYSESGLAYRPTIGDYKNMIDRAGRDEDIVTQKGAFNMPICWIRNKNPDTGAENNWFQADGMSDNKPPFDCRCRDDGKGSKFYDHPDVSDTLKKWLDGAGNC